MIEARPFAQITTLLQDWLALVTTMTSTDVVRQHLEDLIDLCAHVMETKHEPETEEMAPSLRSEIADFFRFDLLGLLSTTRGGSNKTASALREWMTVDHMSSVLSQTSLKQYEGIEDVLMGLSEAEYRGGTFASDLGLAFLFYKSHAGLLIDVGDWFNAFIEAVCEESGQDIQRVDMAEISARFTRAVSVMRLWGYIVGPDGVRRNSSRVLTEAVVEKRIFL
ncbi:hypothetical protein PINS_up002932 [Pythium insidiosum]|nr:hypothetical protein PINS_up002932 [Pythium insidiosum]